MQNSHYLPTIFIGNLIGDRFVLDCILSHAVRSPPANTREGSERGADGLVSCRDRSLGGAISFGRDLCGRSIVHAVIIDRR